MQLRKFYELKPNPASLEDAHRHRGTIGCEIDCPRGSNVVKQVVYGALASCSVLSNKSKESNHSKTGILNLLEFELIKASSNAAGREFEGIKSTTGISRNTSSLEVTFKAEERTFLSLAAGLLHIFKALDLREIEEEQLHHDQRRVRDVRRLLNNLASVIPFGESIESKLGE